MLQGLGEPVNEVRQFVKDVLFRNGQEREQGELALLRERLRLAEEYGLLDTPEAKRAAMIALLERNGKRGRFSKRRPPALPPGEES